MITCQTCKSENSDEQKFCINCGEKLSKDIEKTVIIDPTKNKVAKLVFPNEESYEIDYSQRLIGRADLQRFTKEDPNLISRSHFTIYKTDKKFIIKDGNTNVQNKPSKQGILINGEKPETTEFVLKDGDKILISDIELSFVMQLEN
tara:strand:- start:46 stop:483 length:438 start_codon:yes stop_codon:yes gene_type:complete